MNLLHSFDSISNLETYVKSSYLPVLTNPLVISNTDVTELQKISNKINSLAIEANYPLSSPSYFHHVNFGIGIFFVFIVIIFIVYLIYVKYKLYRRNRIKENIQNKDIELSAATEEVEIENCTTNPRYNFQK